MASLLRRSCPGRFTTPAAFSAVMKWRVRESRVHRTQSFFQGPGHPYEAGQMFIHRLHDYRGIVLFPWWVRVEDINDQLATMSEAKHRPHFDPEDQPKLRKYQLFYPTLVDADSRSGILADQDFFKGQMFLRRPGQTMFRTLCSTECVEIVAHEDIVPISAKSSDIFYHELFDFFFKYDECKEDTMTIPFSVTEELRDMSDRFFLWMKPSVLRCRTNGAIRMSVLPLYLGWRQGFHSIVRIWRFTMRVENGSPEQVSLLDFQWSVINSLRQQYACGTINNFQGVRRRLQSQESAVTFDVIGALPFAQGEFCGTCRLLSSNETLIESSMPQMPFTSNQ